MAPNKSKRGNGASSAPAAAAAAASMPKFTADALTQLTAKIDQNLENRNAHKLNGNSNSNGAGKRKRGADAGGDDDDKEPAGAKPPKTQKKKAAAAPQPKSKAKPVPPANTAKKASSGANDIPVGKPMKEEASEEAPEEAPEELMAKPDKKAIMLDEIKALGGDEADLELVDGLDSDAEEDNRSSGKRAGNDDLSLDASFQSELAKFAAGLGFDQVQLEDEDDDFMEREAEEEEEEVEDEVEDEEDEGEEGEEEQIKELHEAKKKAPEPPKKETKPAPSTDPFPKNPRFSKLMLEPRPDWHQADIETLPAPTSDDITPFLRTINNLKAYADTLLEADSAAYRSISAHSSSHRFMSTIMNSGTQSDKVSALTLEVQEAPVHNAKAFEQLVSLASKRSRGPAIAALAALVDLLGNGVVLPDNRRLRTFQSQPELLGALQTAGPLAHVWNAGHGNGNGNGNDPVLPGKITKAHLMVWKYEDWLKDQFFQILQQLEVWCNDEIEYSRTRSLDFIYGLLKSKPEQEANLLRLLVNKLGDRERKIASRASYLLLQLTIIHPGMKSIVINTIEQEALLRPGQSLRAKYYAINTLNQTILSNKDPATADSLVRIYFELFLVLLKSGALGAIDLTTGQDANAAAERAAKDGKKKKYRRGDKDHKNKNAETKTAPAKNEGNERDVAEKLVSGLLTGVNRAIPFANTDNTTLEGHIDTLFRITHSSNFNTSIQALMLVQQVAASKQVAVERFYRTLYESLLDPRLVTSSKQAMYLNLLFRSLKNDVDVRRVKAFVKRMLQIATLHQPPFVCGILFMVSELETTFPDLKALINEPEFADEDEEEHYRDVPEDGESAAEPVEAKTSARLVYDGRKRDPEYSNAQRSCLWELLPFFAHYHPSVTAFASNLLVRQKTLVKPDIANHTLMHFLDKFVYRNPRAVDVAAANAGLKKARGTSIMQPMAAAASTGAAQVVAPGKAGVDGARKNVAINSAAFWRQDAKDVAAEDIFFHTYFSQVGKQSQTSRAAKRAAKQDKAAAAAAADGQGADDSDAEEEEIWQALKGSRPEIEGGDGGDDEDADAMADMSDDDMSGLESLLNMSDDDDDDLSLDGDDMDVDGDDGGVEFANFSDDDDEEGGASVDKDGLVSVGGEDDPRKASRERKKKLKSMPTFASADDYAEMLAAEADDWAS